MTASQPRNIDEVRTTMQGMPFVRAAGIEIESATEGVGVASMPLSEAVTFDGKAFAAMAVGLIADMAAGAATLITLPIEQLALTAAIDSSITASTAGVRLWARADLRERDQTRLVFDAVVTVEQADGAVFECGTAVVTMRVARPKGG